jgi:hypothetical protein
LALPAPIVLHLIDEIDQPDLEAMLKTQNGMHTITHSVFRDGRHPHVDSISFTVPQTIKTDGVGSRWLSGDMIALYNPEPRFPCPEIRTLFQRGGELA